MRNKTEAYAGYAQADINLTDQLKLTAGIRYTDETKTVSVRDSRASCNDSIREATCMDTANISVLQVSPFLQNCSQTGPRVLP